MSIYGKRIDLEMGQSLVTALLVYIWFLLVPRFGIFFVEEVTFLERQVVDQIHKVVRIVG